MRASGTASDIHREKVELRGIGLIYSTVAVLSIVASLLQICKSIFIQRVYVIRDYKLLWNVQS